MPKTSKVVSSRLAAGAMGLMCLGTCGEETVYVRVNVEGIPAGTKTLSIKSYVDTQAFGEQLFTVNGVDKTFVAGMLLPANTRGTFKAEIAPLDSAGKPLGTCGFDYGGSSTSDILGPIDTSLRVVLAVKLPDAGISGNIYGIWGSKSDDVWVVGDEGLTARWNGCYWQRVESNTKVSLRAIHGFASNNIWAAGGDTANDTNVMVVHWDGAVWKVQQPSTAIRGMITGIWGSASTEMWAIGKGSLLGPMILKGTGGSSWSIFTDAYPGKPSEYTAIHGFDKQHVYITGKAVRDSLEGCGVGYAPPCTGHVTYFDSTTPPDGRWVRYKGDNVLIGELTAVYAESATKIWLGGAGGFIATWGGTSTGIDPTKTMTGITKVTDGLMNTMTGSGIQGIRTFPLGAPQGPFAVVQSPGNASLLYRMDGTTANQLSPQVPIDHPVTALWGASPTDIWMVGNDGLRYHYDGTTIKKYQEPL